MPAMDNPHQELQAAEARRVAITETIHNLSAEGTRLDARIVELRAEVARAHTSNVPCWACQAPPAADIRHALSNHGRSIAWSPGGLPQNCCRIHIFQPRPPENLRFEATKWTKTND
jgi:hypothetical protein